MAKIKEVEEARKLMAEAMDWSTMKWLTEKKRVRTTADLANATLDRVEAETQASWDKELMAAYKGSSNRSADVTKLAKTIKEVHDAAIAAREDAEDTFAKAEKRMSTSLAREGCGKAIHGWDLHEEAIRKAEHALVKK